MSRNGCFRKTLALAVAVALALALAVVVAVDVAVAVAVAASTFSFAKLRMCWLLSFTWLYTLLQSGLNASPRNDVQCRASLAEPRISIPDVGVAHATGGYECSHGTGKEYGPVAIGYNRPSQCILDQCSRGR